MKLLVLFGCLLLVGCGDSSTDTPPVATAPAPTATATPRPNAPKQATSGGITLRVLAVRTARTVKFLEGETSTPKPKQGEHFVSVTTRVTNRTRAELDLSCGVPVRTVLVDSRNRTHEPIKGLSQLRGNPNCDARLRPGGGDRMTWVFLVPRSTELNALAFTDFTDTRKPAPFQQIQL